MFGVRGPRSAVRASGLTAGLCESRHNQLLPGLTPRFAGSEGLRTADRGPRIPAIISSGMESGMRETLDQLEALVATLG